MGAHKKPAALRELHGTANRNKHRDSDNPPEPAAGIGPAPEHMNELQAEIWDEIVGACCPGVLGNSDRLLLERLCVLTWQMRYGDGKEIPFLSGTEGGHMIQIAGRFGMSPSDRQKINLPGKKAESTFQRFK